MKVAFSSGSWEDLRYWRDADPKMLKRVMDLVDDCRRSPFAGIGKPEPLRENWSGWWSRRIDGEHRLIYRLVGKGDDKLLEVAQCRFHYRSARPG